MGSLQEKIIKRDLLTEKLSITKNPILQDVQEIISEKIVEQPQSDTPKSSENLAAIDFNKVPNYHLEFEQRRLQNLALLQQKREAQELYEKEQAEKRHKQLQHLVKQSQFYINMLLKKKPETSIPESKKRKMNAKPNTKLSKKQKSTEQEIVDLLHEDSDDEQNEKLSPEELAKTYVESSFFHGELFDFQKVGVQWLLNLHKNGLNGILADEMGLGKTVQIIAVFAQLAEDKVKGPHVILAPLSTLQNWYNEFKVFAPDLHVILFHGNEVQRNILKKDVNRLYTLPNGFKDFPIILTNYETVLNEMSFFLRMNINYLVIDEGQRIKNHNCRLNRIVTNMHSNNRILLTGTPLQNNLTELWALLNFLLPDVFDDLEVFISWFDVRELQSSEGRAHVLKLEEEKKVIGSLREVLNPFMLRRMKDKVGLNLPPKKETIIYCPMTNLQHELYKAVLNRDYNKLKMIKSEPLIIAPQPGDKRPKRTCRLIKEDPNYVPPQKSDTELETWKPYTTVDARNRDYLINLTHVRTINYRKIVNHPYLINMPLESGLPKINEDIVKLSGKMIVLDKMLTKLHAAGHKVLLFSCWIKILNILEDYLEFRKYKYCRFDGSNELEYRNEEIKKFNTDPSYFVFLITTRSGGVGLNLMAADTVIIYDCDWNPQVDIQALARCHRVGQTRPVMAYKLCTKGTLDEEIYNRGEAKLRLEQAVIGKENFDFKLQLRSIEILMEIFNSSSNTIIRYDNKGISDEELDKLLDRSELIRQMKENEKKSKN